MTIGRSKGQKCMILKAMKYQVLGDIDISELRRICQG